MKISQQIFMFLCVGGINTLVGYLLYAFFIFLHLSYPFALFFAFCIGLIFNFFSTGRVVFKQINNKNFFRFVLVNIFIYILGVILIKLLIYCHFNEYASGLALVLLALPSFLLNKYIAFKEFKTISSIKNY